MFDSIYVGLTGLASFARNLTVIGNNVSNLNTPGFKASQLAFSDLVYGNLLSDAGGGGESLQVGSGVGTDAARIMFTQGTLRQTGNSTDVAITGNGFFALRSNGKTTYTRAGGFQFDSAGYLVSQSGARVAAFAGGALQDINISSLRTSPPKATSIVHLVDNLSSGSNSQDVTATVYDAAGGSHDLTLSLTNNSSTVPQSWLLAVKDSTGTVLSNGEVRFNGDGSPAAGFNTDTFTFAPPGAPSSQVTIDFGDPNSFSGVTNFSAGTNSTIKLGSQDGFAPGALISSAFDQDGVLVASYSNGQTARGQRLALAFFQSPEQLELLGASEFANRSGQPVVLGSPGTGLFGSITGGSLEGANVDIAQEFSDLIISQRGYQASSEVISTTNDMIQQLLTMRSRQG